MGSMKIGYARVSTSGQTVEGQVEQLKSAGCLRVVAETASGAKTDRPRLKALMASLKAGDVLVVTRLDRLARSTSDLLNLMKAFRTSKRRSCLWLTDGPTPPPRLVG
jgi:DNA invertase Pin-like site-specific DNA recombinase